MLARSTTTGDVSSWPISASPITASTGWAYCGQRTIRIKINPLNQYPLYARVHRGLPPLSQHDAVEVLVRVTAHEVAHIERYERFVRDHRRRGGRDTECERATERMARNVLDTFRRDRDRLLASWGDAGPGPIPPSTVHRLTCRRCGCIRQYARALSSMRKRSCGRCFSSWEEAANAGEFLVYEVIPHS